MSGYRPQVGDVVRRPNWPDDWAEEVTAVDDTHFISADDEDPSERCLRKLSGEWIKVEPKPEIEDRWINWGARGPIAAHRSRATADRYADALRLFVLHVGMRDDEYFAEIEPS